MYPAHIVTLDGRACVQTVGMHCRNTATYAADALRPVSLSACGAFVGMLHDLGKLTTKFAAYLRRAAAGETGERGQVNHTFAGVIFILETYHGAQSSAMENLTAEILAWAVASHHGLVDLVDLEGNSGFLHRLQKDRQEICYDEVLRVYEAELAEQTELDALFEKAVAEIMQIMQRMQTDCAQTRFCTKKSARGRTLHYLCGMTARLILSALLEGDRRDTAEFMSGQKQCGAVGEKALWAELLQDFEQKLRGLKADTPINQARAYISDCARDFAANENGIYRLTVPTGAGKTLAALRFALAHAEAADKRRIIFVIPLLSVLEQNAAVLKSYIGRENLVTEHHSNVVHCDNDQEALDHYELIAQTWETPILITTLVQLLNTLFSGKTTAVRRMKSLCNAILVIDEVQSLPHKLLYLFNEAVNFLVYYCNATVVLSSATQPCLETMDYFLALPQPSDMVPYNAALFSAFQRTEVVDQCTPYGMSLDELADFAAERLVESENLLIICNTRLTARNLFLLMQQMCRCKVYHLSNNMCMQHRIDTLQKINQSLQKHEKLVCVATQLVECGVDFSFACCIRIKAGIDNIAQAAGRCNRSNDYGRICKVYIVSLKNENLSHLQEISESQSCTTQFLMQYRADPARFENDILSEESVHAYYQALFGNFIEQTRFAYPVKHVGNLFSLLSDNITYAERNEAGDRFRMTQAFKTAGQLFEVFDSETVDVLVPYDAQAKALIADLCSEKAQFDYSYLHQKMEAAKPYMIHLFMDRTGRQAQMLTSCGKGHITVLLEAFYNAETGLNEAGNTF